MALTQEDLRQVTAYLQTHIDEWLPQPVLHLSERIVRVEEELKHQRELMMQGFANINKRFSTLTWMIGIGFVVVTSLVTVFALLA
jgi:uncharacterized circularly permuted ATP-grasp superfamily protein